MNAEVTVAVIVLIGLSIPIIGALWKIFTIKEALSVRISFVESSLSASIKDNAHRLDIAELKMENVQDVQITATNGTKELVEHVRSRTQKECNDINLRLEGVEGFLEKHTKFIRRKRE